MKQALLFYIYYRWEDRGFGRINNFPQITVSKWVRQNSNASLSSMPMTFTMGCPASVTCIPDVFISLLIATTRNFFLPLHNNGSYNWLTLQTQIKLLNLSQCSSSSKNNWSSSERIRGKLGLPTLCSYLQSSSSFSSGIKCAEGNVELKWEGMGEEGKWTPFWFSYLPP